MPKVIHIREKSYHCSQCGNTFGWKSQLTQHEMINTEEMVYQCNQYSKTSDWKSKLTMHKMIHTGETPSSV
jgi:KRAB domain-containing zinc finger protein